MFGKSKKTFDSEEYVRSQNALYPHVSINETIKNKIPNPKILVYESLAMKALRGGGNFSGTAVNTMMKNSHLNPIDAGAHRDNPKYKSQAQPEIESDELFITNNRIFATLHGESVVLEACFNKDLVKQIMTGQAKRNSHILEEIVPKPDKGDEYSGKLAYDIQTGIRGPLTKAGYVLGMNILIGVEVKKGSIFGGKMFEIEIAGISSPLNIDDNVSKWQRLKSWDRVDRKLTFANELKNEVKTTKYEIKVKNDKNVNNEEIMLDFVQNETSRINELKEYAIVQDDKKIHLSKQFMDDFNA